MTYIAARKDGVEGAPLFFTFHGTGGDEHQFHGLAADLLPSAHIVSPRGDVSEMGANRFFRRTGEGVYDMDDLWARAETMAAFMEAERKRAGAEQVIALGYSNGANILASVALIRPDLVDDMVLMHPLIPWSPDPQPALAGTRVLITAGRHDPIGPAPLTEALGTYLSSQGAEVRLEWHDGGHELRQSEVTAITSFLAAETVG
ncbi:MAG: alpha/beta hydrolase [Pseudomonadota bacterium]